MNETAANWISLMAVIYMAAPVFLFVTFRNMNAFRIFFIILIADVSTVVIKYLTRNFGMQFLKRPTGASGCGTFLGGTRQGGEPGFPSGHMATTVAFWTCIYYLTPQEFKQYILILGFTASAAMMWARMKKSCHTALQTISGGLLGFMIGWLGSKFAGHE